MLSAKNQQQLDLLRDELRSKSRTLRRLLRTGELDEVTVREYGGALVFHDAFLLASESINTDACFDGFVAALVCTADESQQEIV